MTKHYRTKTQVLANKIGKGKTASESFQVINQREVLQTQIDKFQNLSLAIMKINSSRLLVRRIYKTGDLDDLDQLGFDDDEGDWLAADIEETIEEEEPEVTAENVILNLPSNFTVEQRKEYGLEELGRMEYQLREGQANDALEKLRDCLAEKSMRFRTGVRLAKGQRKVTRAWDSIHRVDNQIKQAVAIYRRARHAIGELGDGTGLKRFQEIKRSDLKMSGDIVEENRVGQKSSVLPWFWRLDRKVKGNHSSYEKECKYNSQKVSNQYS